MPPDYDTFGTINSPRGRLYAMLQRYQLYYKNNLYLAYPIVISQLGHTLVGLSDSIIIGHTGEVPLAAVSLGNSIFTIFMVTGIGMAYGLTPLIAQENGRGNKAYCGRLLSQSLLINIITGVFLCAVIIAGSQYIHLLDQPAEVAELARVFLRLLGLSFVPMMIFLSFKQFAEGLGFTRQAMHISIIGNLVNIALGVTLVFGWFGLPRMGITGVGIATLTDRTLMAVTMAWYVMRAQRFKPYLREFTFSGATSADKRRILGLGMPVALQYIFEVSAFSSAVIMAGWMGAREQAAHQIANSLAMITYMMASGISAAAGIKSGNYLGAGQIRELRMSAIASYHMVSGLMIIAALVFVLGNELLPRMYIKEEAVVDIAGHLLIIAAFFQLLDGIQVVGLGILRGMGDVKVPTVISLLAYWVVGVPVGYLLGIYFHLGIQGIWWGLSLGLLVASGLLFLRFQQKILQL